MKILLLNNLFPPFARGGAEAVAARFAQAAQAAGHEVAVVSSRPWGQAEPAAGGLRVHWLAGFAGSYYHLSKLPYILRPLWHAGNLLAGRRKFLKILEQERPDLVISHNLAGLGLGVARACRQLKIKHWHTLHDVQLLHPSGLVFYGQEGRLDTIRARLYQAVARRQLAGAAGVISPSTWLLQEHLRRGFFAGARPAVLPNPMPTVSAQPASEGGPELRLAYLGQLEPHKDVVTLVKAVTGLSKAPLRLSLIGQGSQAEALKRLAGNDRRVSFLGRLENDQALARLAQADLLVLPSVCHENSPTVIYEAFAAGVPVLAARVGGIGELLDQDERFLFTPGSVKELQEKLLWAVAHKDELAGWQAPARGRLAGWQAEKYCQAVLAATA